MRFEYKSGKRLFFVVTIVFLLMFSSIQLQDKVRAQITEQRTLVFEDGFEGSIANFWNENHGTTSLSTAIAHSGSYSLVVNGEEGGLVHNFPATMSGEKWDFEAWFYDNLSISTRTFALAVGGSSIIGVFIGSGGDFNQFYAYSTNNIGTIPRSQGWHNATIIGGPENLTIYIDRAKLYQTSSSFSFNRFFFGDWWQDSSICNTYYDDIKVWNYQSNNPSPTLSTTPSPTTILNPTPTETPSTLLPTENPTPIPSPGVTQAPLITPNHSTTPIPTPKKESNSFLFNPATTAYIFAGIFAGSPILTFVVAKIIQNRKAKNGLEKPKLTFNKLFGITLLLIILGTVLTSGVIALNNTMNAPKPPQQNIVSVKIVIESNIDWTGSATITGPDYGFYPISGSMSDSINKDNATYNYQYTANYADLDIEAQFTENFFGQGVTLYDGFLHAREYVNGTLKFEITLTPFTANGFEWSYDAGYS